MIVSMRNKKWTGRNSVVGLILCTFGVVAGTAVESEPVSVDAAHDRAEMTDNDDATSDAAALEQAFRRKADEMGEAIRAKIGELRQARQSQVGREMILRREDPAAIAILEDIEALEARIQAKNDALREQFAQDETWQRLQSEVEQRETAVTEARRELVEWVRERKQREFDQRQSQPES